MTFFGFEKNVQMNVVEVDERRCSFGAEFAPPSERARLASDTRWKKNPSAAAR